jgi:hypothetical protein
MLCSNLRDEARRIAVSATATLTDADPLPLARETNERLFAMYRVEVKNPKAPAVKREAEKDWGRLKRNQMW